MAQQTYLNVAADVLALALTSLPRTTVFTLHDLVSYEQRHNHCQTVKKNRDGHGTNFSCNNGLEGHTNDIEVNQLRAQQKRNMLTTLLIAQGTPMLLAGDEFGNSQNGNNNAYCQDNEITWLNWREKDDELLDFVKRLIKLRKDHPLLNRTLYKPRQLMFD